MARLKPCPSKTDLCDHVYWRLEGVVDLNLIAVDQTVGFVRHADHGHQFVKHGGSHALFARRSTMRGDAVAATIGDTHRDVQHLLDEGIKRAGSHDLLHAVPRSLQQYRVVSD